MINVEKMRFDLFLRSDEDEKTMEKVRQHKYMKTKSGVYETQHNSCWYSCSGSPLRFVRQTEEIDGVGTVFHYEDVIAVANTREELL